MELRTDWAYTPPWGLTTMGLCNCLPSKNIENNKYHSTLARLLAQAEGSRSGERDSRSGELPLPRRGLDNLK